MKLYVLFTVLMIGTVGYVIVELLHRRKQKRLKAIAEDPKAAEANQPEETDDEKDDIDDDIIITHLWTNFWSAGTVNDLRTANLIARRTLVHFIASSVCQTRWMNDGTAKCSLQFHPQNRLQF